jgi:hypothetical protein
LRLYQARAAVDVGSRLIGMRRSSSGKLHGTIPINTGGLSLGGLWAIEFGVGGNNGSPDVLHFADGINSEMDGLFGAITAH